MLYRYQKVILNVDSKRILLYQALSLGSRVHNNNCSIK